jgi:hypothetical protein
MSIVLGFPIGGMPVRFGLFSYRCDSCELVSLGYSWVTKVQIHAYMLSKSKCYSLQLRLMLSLSCSKIACHYFPTLGVLYVFRLAISPIFAAILYYSEDEEFFDEDFF